MDQARMTFADGENDGSDSSLRKNRPTSRRGPQTPYRELPTQDAKSERSFSRPMSIVGSEESGTVFRPASGVARLQGTASRLLSASSQQRNLTMTVTPAQLDRQGSVTDRLITQQGLSSRARSSGTALRGPGKRLVLDKRYYEGLLQMKIQELTNEIASLRKETEINNKEREDFMVYDRQNKERAKELIELQSTLADYNLVMDKIHIGAEIKDIESECQELKKANDIEQTNLEKMFNERTQTQRQIHQLEEEIKKERYATEKLMENMSPEMRDKYARLSDENIKLQKTIDQIQRELDDITKEKALFEQQISTSQLKQETIELELKLSELEEKRRNLISEESENDASNLHKNYLNRAKEDNVEISTMERSMNQLQDELKNYEKQLEQVEQDLEECQSERHKKYLELRKREETIESFLSTYDRKKDEENENRKKLKSEIVRTMIAISQHLLTLPATENEYELVTKDEPQIEGDELKGQHSLYVQYKQKQLYLDKLIALETKLQNEENSLQERVENTQTDIDKFRNLDALKEDCEMKRLELQNEKSRYLETRDTIEDEFKRAKKEYGKIEKELQQNETHNQLKALERKLALIEEENSAMREFIADKKSETNYSPCKQLVLDLLKKYNDELKEKYQHTLQEAII